MDNSFSAFDYGIFGVVLAISASIGVFFGCFGSKQSTSKELLLANKQMGVFPAAMSLIASFMSGITVLGNPQEAYLYGTMFWWTGIAHIFVALVTSQVFIPLFYKSEFTSAYEYFEKRFNKYVRLMASCIFIFQMSNNMALVLYAPALALNQVTGLNIWISVISIGAVCTFYTAIGGMTDVFQVFIMLIGLIASIVKGLIDVGGIQNVIETNWKYDRIEFFNFDPNPTTRHTVWGLTIGIFVAALSLFGIIGGPLLGLFCLGLFFPFANTKGAIAGIISGLTITFWLFIGFNVYGIRYPKKPLYTDGCFADSTNQTSDFMIETTTTTQLVTSAIETKSKSGMESFYSISYVWYGPIGVMSVCLVGAIVSLLTGPTKPDQIDSKYIYSLGDQLFPCLPESVKNFMRCGFKNKVIDKEMNNSLEDLEKYSIKTIEKKGENFAFEPEPVYTQTVF